MTEKKDHYIDGFIVTMKKKYNMSKEEAEKTITYFLQVIDDASRYLFSLNHSQPYSYEGYASGWLRYHYPLEFLTVALNINKKKEEKTNALTNYAKKNNIQIKNPLFRYSKSSYFCDKEDRCIYKGVGSIKYMNDKVAEELFELRNNHYDSFIDLLKDIKYKTTLNSTSDYTVKTTDLADECTFEISFKNSLITSLTTCSSKTSIENACVSLVSIFHLNYLYTNSTKLIKSYQ